jgi:DNA topoisomerase III
MPTALGVGLVETYESLGIELYKPYLRAEMERDMKRIADGEKQSKNVLQECTDEMLKIFTQCKGSENRFKNIF